MLKKILLPLSYLISINPLFPVSGCVTPIEKSIPKADFIFVGKILNIREVQVEACQEPLLVPCDIEDKLPPDFDLEECKKPRLKYKNCGEVWNLKVKTKWALKGIVDTKLNIFVAPNYYFNQLSSFPCDDRLPVPEMLGKEAVFFIKVENSRFWSVDGADSILTHGGKVRKSNPTILKIINEIEKENYVR
jgi:hypothetical protein